MLWKSFNNNLIIVKVPLTWRDTGPGGPGGACNGGAGGPKEGGGGLEGPADWMSVDNNEDAVDVPELPTNVDVLLYDEVGVDRGDPDDGVAELRKRLPVDLTGELALLEDWNTLPGDTGPNCGEVGLAAGVDAEDDDDTDDVEDLRDDDEGAGWLLGLGKVGGGIRFKLFDFVMVVLYPDLGASESWLNVSGAAFSTVIEVAFSFSGELILLQKAKWSNIFRPVMLCVQKKKIDTNATLFSFFMR